MNSNFRDRSGENRMFADLRLNSMKKLAFRSPERQFADPTVVTTEGVYSTRSIKLRTARLSSRGACDSSPPPSEGAGASDASPA